MLAYSAHMCRVYNKIVSMCNVKNTIFSASGVETHSGCPRNHLGLLFLTVNVY